MKPRPIVHILQASRSQRADWSLQCRRNFHPRPLAGASSYAWHNPSLQRPAHPSRTLLRYASSASTAKPRPSLSPADSAELAAPARSPTSNVPSLQVRAKLNPPAETYAPELNVPPRKQGQNYFKYLFQCGKLYIQFYKQGIRNVRATAKIAKTLRQKAAKLKGTAKDVEGLGVLTRAEWQIVRRSRRDMMRLPAFGALILLLGEWLPVVALYITPLIPEPCRIPAQIQRSQRKREARRKERERRLAIDAARLVARDRKPGVVTKKDVEPNAVRIEELDKMGLYALLGLSTKLDAHGAMWDRLFITPPKGVLRWDLRRKLEYLKKDDKLIERDGGWQALDSQEVQNACMERGIRVLGRNEGELRRELAAWSGR